MMLEKFAEEIVMSNLSRWQQTTVANFLLVSRMHFGLCRRRTGLWPRLIRFRRTIFQSLLIAGSIGSQFGGAAYAETSVIEKPETRTERAASSDALAEAERATRIPVERMP